MGIGLADFDLDGWMDFFVANDKVYNSFFHNKGDGKFEEISFEAGVALTEDGQFISGMGVDARDLDNDGLPDIVFVALDMRPFRCSGTSENASSPISRPKAAWLALPCRWTATHRPLPISTTTAGRMSSLRAATFNPASYVSNVPVDQPNTVFRNLGAAKFEALTAEAGLTAQPPSRHRGSAVGDLNGDGRLDVVVTALSAPAEVWLNDSPGGNHWIEFALQGSKSNRDGIGARIKVVADGITQYNHVCFAAGYASSSAGPTHFGLGASKTVDLVEIRWPSGITQELRNVAADRILKVREPPK